MATPQSFYLSEADSEIVGARQLAQAASSANIQLDFPLAISAALDTIEEFLTGRSLPGRTSWAAGIFELALTVAEAPAGVSYTIELWRADVNGADVDQIGEQAEAQTGVGAKTFTIIAPVESAGITTDRLKVKLLAANADDEAAANFAILSGGRLTTPIAGFSNPAAVKRQTGFFIGHIQRPGEDEIDPDGFIEL